MHGYTGHPDNQLGPRPVSQIKFRCGGELSAGAAEELVSVSVKSLIDQFKGLNLPLKQVGLTSWGWFSTI